MWTRSLALLSIISLSIGDESTVDYEGCKFNLTDSNGITAEYDLSWFHGTNQVYRVIDTQNTFFEYVFNICGSLEPSLFTNSATIPEACSHPQSGHGPCIKIGEIEGNPIPQCDVEDSGFEPTVGETPSAVQIDTLNPNETNCYWLGMEIKTSDGLPEYQMELLDPDDAGKGVVFTILNGEWCSSVGRNRELRITLECPDDPRIEFIPQYHRQQIQETTVTEENSCVYELAVISPNACPNKCISRVNLEMFAVCATHGICEADPYGNGLNYYPNGTLRCLCDDGYTGTKCEQTYNEITIIQQNHPGLFTAIVICIILLGLAIVLAAILCHKIRMKELVETESMHHLAGGMLSDENEAAVAQRKAEAVSMNIGSTIASTTGAGSSVQLQTVDDQMEKDKEEDHRNALLETEDDEQQVVEAKDEDEEEEEVVTQTEDNEEDAISGDQVTQNAPNHIAEMEADDEDAGVDIAPDTTEQTQDDEENEETTEPGNDQ